ncbi:MAG: methyltransferase domain-containing protein [Vallitalea sp.]|jgi:16S rRNA C1402 N4-methylase RsmH|nr:methyltransferase domain-containing protein [Vallitalea sp.]
MFEPRITDTVQGIIKDYIYEGDVVIDATVGNGFDTVFLAEQVGENGEVYGFDIQDIAIEQTKIRLNQRKLMDRVTLIKDSHENINKYVKSSVKAAMFNLGYLPKGDKKIITKPESTIKSIEQIIDMLESNGLISIISYYGHEGGKEEKDVVELYLGELNNKKYDVITVKYENRKMNAPIIYLVRKK